MSIYSIKSSSSDNLGRIDGSISSLSQILDSLKDVVRSKVEPKLMLARLKREKLRALQAAATSYNILAEMDILIATKELGLEIGGLVSDSKENDRVHRSLTQSTLSRKRSSCDCNQTSSKESKKYKSTTTATLIQNSRKNSVSETQSQNSSRSQSTVSKAESRKSSTDISDSDCSKNTQISRKSQCENKLVTTDSEKTQNAKAPRTRSSQVFPKNTSQGKKTQHDKELPAKNGEKITIVFNNRNVPRQNRRNSKTEGSSKRIEKLSKIVNVSRKSENLSNKNDKTDQSSSSSGNETLSNRSAVKSKKRTRLFKASESCPKEQNSQIQNDIMDEKHQDEVNSLFNEIMSNKQIKNEPETASLASAITLFLQNSGC